MNRAEKLANRIKEIEQYHVAFYDVSMEHPTEEGRLIFISGYISPNGALVLVLDEKKYNPEIEDNIALGKNYVHAEDFSAWVIQKQRKGWKFIP